MGPRRSEVEASVDGPWARTVTNRNSDGVGAAHRALDEAVFAAYGWPMSLSDDELLAKLLELNLAMSENRPRRD